MSSICASTRYVVAEHSSELTQHIKLQDAEVATEHLVIWTHFIKWG